MEWTPCLVLPIFIHEKCDFSFKLILNFQNPEFSKKWFSVVVILYFTYGSNCSFLQHNSTLDDRFFPSCQ